MPDFVAPQLCASVERPPNSDGWVHEIKFDGYRMQLRVEDGEVALNTRKGLDWTDKFAAIAKRGEIASRLHHRRRDRRARSTTARRISPRCRRRCPTARPSNLIFFAFDLLFSGGEDLRSLPLARAQGAAEATAREAQGRQQADPLRRAFRDRGDAVLQSARKLSLEGIISKRLDAPYRSGRRESWTKAKCRAGHEVVIGGWTTTNGKFRSLLVGVHRGDHLLMSAGSAPASAQDTVRRIMPALKAAASDKSPFSGKDAPKKAARRALAEAGAGRRDRVRRLDRRRHGAAGRVQGPARRTSRRTRCKRRRRR